MTQNIRWVSVAQIPYNRIDEYRHTLSLKGIPTRLSQIGVNHSMLALTTNMLGPVDLLVPEEQAPIAQKIILNIKPSSVSHTY